MVEKSREQEYREYLRSETWRGLRDQVLARCKGACEFCGDPVADVHHVKYPKRFGDEELNDLAGVCRRCHELSHGRVEMKTLSGAVTMQDFALNGRPFPYLVCDDARVWSTFDHWRAALQIPSEITERFRSGIVAGAAESSEYKARTEKGADVYRYHAAERALEFLEYEYMAEQAREVHRRRWNDQEREAREIVHKNYRALRKWAADLQEKAFASRVKALRETSTHGGAVTPQMLVDAIKEAVAPRLHRHDEQIAAHDVVIGAIKEAAPFLRNGTEFISIRQGAMEIGLDPAWMPQHPQSRLNICGLAGRALAESGVERGPKVTARLDGSAATAEMNTYRRTEVYAALRDISVAGGNQALPLKH